MKTREDVEALKDNWLKDPMWDLADTPGFEEYHSELDKFQDEQEAKWKAAREEKEKQSFEYRAKAILTKLETNPVDAALNPDLHTLLIAKQQVKATLLLAEQVQKVAEILEGMAGYDQYIRGF